MKTKNILTIILTFLLLATTPLSVSAAESDVITLPFIGELDTSQNSLLLATILIAGADGFNPCSIWMLLFLLGMVIHTGSRKKIAIVGITFLSVTTLIYGLFISGVVAVMDILSHITWLTYFIVGLALIFGAVNVKDFFFYKKGLSFTIPDKYKPKIFKDTRNVVKEKSTLQTIILTATLAAGIAIIELPCTAGLPLIWSGLMANAEVSYGYGIYLTAYLLTYLGIEIILLIIALVSLKSFKMTEFKGRSLKLVGGLLIIALAGILLIDQSLMYSITGVFSVIIGTLLLSAIIIAITNHIEASNSNKAKIDNKKNKQKKKGKKRK